MFGFFKKKKTDDLEEPSVLPKSVNRKDIEKALASAKNVIDKAEAREKVVLNKKESAASEFLKKKGFKQGWEYDELEDLFVKKGKNSIEFKCTYFLRMRGFDADFFSSEKALLEIVKIMPSIFNDVNCFNRIPKKYLTEKICLAAVRNMSCGYDHNTLVALFDIPEKFRTKAVCLLVLNRSIELGITFNFRNVPEKIRPYLNYFGDGEVVN